MSTIMGGIRQVGFVVRDIEAAMKMWIGTMGVGPWFYRKECPMAEFNYYGKPSRFPELSLAFANSGELQIELIQQHNDAPSLYRDMLLGQGEGVQHVAYWTSDRYDEWKACLERGGYVEGQSGRMGPQGRFGYFVNPALPGSIIEISETTGGKAERFKAIRDASIDWDGRDPIRLQVLPSR